MSDLLKRKDELINQMFIITKEAKDFLCDDSFDDYEKLSEIYSQRGKIIKEVDALDKEMKAQGISINDNPEIKNSIGVTLEGIASLDEQIAEMVKKKSDEFAADLKKIQDGRKAMNMQKEGLSGVHLDVSQ
ncbi:MAG: hypothetical protein IJR47_01245 [Clostridia bacterium]|nr:hypothetical protein [Clostridia bacterium]